MRNTSTGKRIKLVKKSIYSEKHTKLCEILTEGRKKAGLTQQELAKMIGKQQSFVAKYEGGERRLDLIELIEISNRIGLDLLSVVKKLT
jgi:transcriptional regulator with XRE-family HTH domain